MSNTYCVKIIIFVYEEFGFFYFVKLPVAGYINTCLQTPTFLKRLLKSLVFQNQQEILGVKILKNRKIPIFSGKILIKIDTTVLIAGRTQSLIICDQL